MRWNLGDLFDAVAGAVPPEAPALIHGDRSVSWAEMLELIGNPRS